MKRVKVKDIIIAYEIFGESSSTLTPPLLLITGYRAAMTLWPARFIERLATAFKVVIFDNRGMGNSTASEKDFTIELFADDASGLLEALNISKASVFGWSMGSYIAQEFSLKYEDKLDKLILFAGSCGGNEAVWPDDSVVNALINASGTEKEQLERILNVLFPREWILSHPDPFEYFPLSNEKLSSINITRQINAIVNWPGTSERLSSMKTPTLIISGDKDLIAPPENSRILNKKIHDSVLCEIIGCGHGALMQYPEKIADIVIDFIKS